MENSCVLLFIRGGEVIPMCICQTIQLVLILEIFPLGEVKILLTTLLMKHNLHLCVTCPVRVASSSPYSADKP